MNSLDILNYSVIGLIILGFFFLGLTEYKKVANKTEEIEEFRFKEEHIIIISYTFLIIISIIIWESLFDFFISAHKMIGNHNGF